MLNTKSIGDLLKKNGFDFYAGVPCSFLKSLINYAINECDYVMSANEGDAVATCAGAYLGGRKTVVLFQNSGLTNATSPLTSLIYTFKIPILGFVSLRGEAGINDEPQHELMGQITTQFLENMKISWEYLSDNIIEAQEQIFKSTKVISENNSFFFVVKKNTFDEVAIKSKKLLHNKNNNHLLKKNADHLPTRAEVLKSLSATLSNDVAFLATTGHTGRELFEVNDSEKNLYMVGSMGCILSLGLGMAMVKANKKIVVIDGDGSLLMRMGSMATTSYYSPHNLIHILLDNNSHASTGGQATVSHVVDFVSCAANIGYTNAFYVNNIDELKQYIDKWTMNPVLTFIYMKISNSSLKNLGRPTIKPVQVKERFMRYVNS